MKIKHIGVHVIKTELDVPFAFSQGWVNQRAATLIEIITDEGITGWGLSLIHISEPTRPY